MSYYRVERRDGLLIIHNPIPIDDMVALVKDEPKGSLADSELSQRMGVVLVCGMPDALAAERERQEARDQ